MVKAVCTVLLYMGLWTWLNKFILLEFEIFAIELVRIDLCSLILFCRGGDL